MNKQINTIPDRALEALYGHRWRGNVRELPNVIECAGILSTDEVLRI